MAMASAPAALVAVLLVAGRCTALAPTTFRVGDARGWTTGVDYSRWASGKPFVVGDELVFYYAPKAHTVTEVNASGYAACAGTNVLSDYDKGASTVTLADPGPHYFICIVPGHCAAGMKLAVTVSATPSSVAAAATGAAAGAALVPPGFVVVAAAAGAALIKLVVVL